MIDAAFYCVADERYFLGAVAVVNSLRLHGHTEPVFVGDCGLTSRQRELLDPHATVVVDEGLLGILPPLVEGATLTVDAETATGIAAQVAADPGLAGDLEAVAVALYAGEADYAVVTLTRLRDGVFRDDYFRDWRDSFDEAVCAQSGGVEGHAEATIGGRTTFIGTCAGGVRTYHTRLEGPDRIVSLQALGEGRYGERILAGLTE